MDKIRQTNGWVKNYKRVAKCNDDFTIIQEYDSQKEVLQEFNVKSGGGLSIALKNPNRKFKGYKWKRL